ncbi:MAG: gamma carbonic anhydrase family protein [Acidobacteria bacterium]|nr:gamma carbonic anhydrase family protein [Acidobacteriota bacterium]
MLRSHRSGSPRVASSAFVDDSAQVIGDVEIGDQSSVWMNVVIRGDVNHIRVGARTNIQDGSVIHVQRETHPTVIGDDVTVGHAAILHGCVVQDRCLIGMGAIILNGAVIGSGSIIAAGTLVVEGTDIPAGSLVMGNPGRIRRSVTDTEAASIAQYAANYVNYKAEFET